MSAPELRRLNALLATGNLSNRTLVAIDRACDIEDSERADAECDRPFGKYQWQAMQKRIIDAGVAGSVLQ